MAKKERNFHGEADFLRHYLRELAAETGTVIKDTNFMKKEECKEEIEALNRVKYKKELETERNEIIEKFENDLIDRNNQITTLQKEKVELENAKKDYLKEIIAKTELIKTHEKEIKELQESNEFMGKIIENNEKELLEKEKEIKELKAERNSSQLSLAKKEKEIEEKNIELERYKKINKKLEQDMENSLAVIKELKNRKWYDPFLFWKKK